MDEVHDEVTVSDKLKFSHTVLVERPRWALPLLIGW